MSMGLQMQTTSISSPPAESRVPDLQRGPAYVPPSHAGPPLKQCPPALTSFQCGGRIGTYRCARTVAAPAQTQGPAAPARPGGSSAGHSSAPAGEASGEGQQEAWGSRPNILRLQDGPTFPTGICPCSTQRPTAQPRDCLFLTRRQHHLPHEAF